MYHRYCFQPIQNLHSYVAINITVVTLRLANNYFQFCFTGPLLQHSLQVRTGSWKVSKTRSSFEDRLSRIFSTDWMPFLSIVFCKCPFAGIRLVKTEWWMLVVISLEICTYWCTKYITLHTQKQCTARGSSWGSSIPVSDHWRLIDPPRGRVAKPLVSSRWCQYPLGRGSNDWPGRGHLYQSQLSSSREPAVASVHSRPVWNSCGWRPSRGSLLAVLGGTDPSLHACTQTLAPADVTELNSWQTHHLTAQAHSSFGRYHSTTMAPCYHFWRTSSNPSVPLSSATLGKLLTHMFLYHQAV